MLGAPQLLPISPPCCGEHEDQVPRAARRPLHPPPCTVPLRSPTSAGLYFPSDGQVWRWLPPIPTYLGPQAIWGGCATCAKALRPLGDSTSTTQHPSCLPGALVLPPAPQDCPGPYFLLLVPQVPRGSQGFPSSPPLGSAPPQPPLPLGTPGGPWGPLTPPETSCPGFPGCFLLPSGTGAPFPGTCTPLMAAPSPSHIAQVFTCLCPSTKPPRLGRSIRGAMSVAGQRAVPAEAPWAWGGRVGRAEPGSPQGSGCSSREGPTRGAVTPVHAGTGCLADTALSRSQPDPVASATDKTGPPRQTQPM